VKQLSLFDAPSPYRVNRSENHRFDQKGLMQWKDRIFTYQQKIKETQPPQQQTLLAIAPEVSSLGQPSPEQIDPFSLSYHSSLFWRQKVNGHSGEKQQGCLYFIIDRTVPLLLYVGETKLTAHHRWRGTHDCKDYILRYLELHRRYQVETAVVSAFYPLFLRKKELQTWEQALILKWRSPFNKECWQYWGQPFGKIA